MNDKFNKNAKVEKFTNLVGKAVRLIVIYLSKVLTERFSTVYKTQTKEDIRFPILTLVLVDINFTFSAKVWIQLWKSFDCDRFSWK